MNKPSPQRLLKAIQAGAHGILDTNMSTEALIQSLKLVLTGQKVVPSFVVDLLSETRMTPPPMLAELNGSMTSRELQILDMVVRGASNKAIGLALGISEPTVKFYVKTLMRKVHASNRTQIAVWAMSNGYGQEGQGAAHASLWDGNGKLPSSERGVLRDRNTALAEGPCL
jgi:two-component system nitrate/nitrite response regulator NarL